MKNIVYRLAGLSGSLKKYCIIFVGERLAILVGDLAFLFQIRFVAGDRQNVQFVRIPKFEFF